MSDFIVGGESPSPRHAGDIDWGKLKADVAERLDIEAEFRDLGVRFTGKRRGDYILECHSADREDVNPSAFVNTRTAVYSDSGNGGKSLHLFQFAVTHGSFNRWSDAAKSFAEKAGVPFGKVTKTRGRIRECTYDYFNADGSKAFRIFRYIEEDGSKSFSQHAPNGKGGWKFGEGAMRGVVPVPYRLPEILASDAEDPIYVCEGEKAAEAVADLGLTATTGHGGSKNTKNVWSVIADRFIGRDVYILPDNDVVGIESAEKIAGCLSGMARIVKVVRLPNLPPKGDAVEWIADGGTAEALGSLCHAAPEWRPGILEAAKETAKEAEKPRTATVADLRKHMSKESWIWPGWIPSASLALLAAEAGCGKTRLIFDIHRRMYQGLPMPDGFVPEVPFENPKFLWIPADSQYRELCNLPLKFGIPDELVCINTDHTDPFGGTSLETMDDLKALEARIMEVRPTLVVIDTITNTGNFKSENSSDAKQQYQPLQNLAIKTQTAILCVTHLGLSGKALGRRVIEKVRTVIQLSQPDPENQTHRRKLWIDKSFDEKPPALGVTMSGEGNEYDLSPPEAPPEGEAARKGPPPAKILECAQWLEGQLKDRQILRVSDVRHDAEKAGFATGTLYKAKDHLQVIEEESPTGRGKKWFLPPAPYRPQLGA